MLKKLTVLALSLLAALCLTATAWADYDYIDRYEVSATPNTDDGSLHITVSLTWTALEDLPYGQELKIGVPNGSIRDATTLTDNIQRLDFDNSYMYVYLDRAYDADETFTFSYAWTQEYMYTLDGDAVTYDYTPGWFDEAEMGEMTLTWHDPAGLTGDFTEGTISGADSVRVADGLTITASDLSYGYKMNVQVRYTDWPTTLSPDNSADYTPDDGWYDYDDSYDDSDDAEAIVGMLVFIFILVVIVLVIRSRGDGYAGGFGTRYVFVNHLWYPAGPDGKPRPGSVGTKTRPARPAAAALAEAAAAAASEGAALAAADTVPAPPAAPVPVRAPVPAAVGPAAPPRTCTAQSVWTIPFPASWIPDEKRDGGAVSLFMPCRPARPPSLFFTKKEPPCKQSGPSGWDIGKLPLS